MDTLQAEKVFSAGEIIMTQGEVGSCAYLIQEGRVGIVVEKEDGKLLQMGTRGPGSIIGEMAIVDSKPRSATIKSLEQCKLLEITKEDYARSVDSANPILRLVSQVILMRYRDILRRSQTLLSDSLEFPSPEELEREYAESINVVDAIKMANEFKVAITSNQLFLNYQPIVSMATGEVVAFEALMRWNHPERGLIPPDEFIPMAEDSGLIVDASRWAVREVCDMLARLDINRPDLSKLYISVNFSSTDFEDVDFLTHLHRTLDESGTDASRVHIEITERLLMRQPKDVKETLDTCRSRGMGVAIDDFGTGYSSLSYLHQYPIDTLKIDQSFIRQMRDDDSVKSLVKSIVALSENLNIRVIAEGVEELEEAEFLQALNCGLAQGYLYSRPIAEADVLALLNKHNPV